MATEGRSLRSGRTLPDPSDPLDSSLVEPESERESDRDSNAEEEDGDMWVDNERCDVTITMFNDIIMMSSLQHCLK